MLYSWGSTFGAAISFCYDLIFKGCLPLAHDHLYWYRKELRGHRARAFRTKAKGIEPSPRKRASGFSGME